ncbi:MAG: hypothetical protein LQ350_006635 [Teloschistes chrysophthalmus]|nr:MAG: hypothetical protein LQ350_006635 [Niorma chrysophthalma]
MPGRRSTAPLPLLSKTPLSKNHKRKKQRALNALAIAEKIEPERIRTARHRLGGSENESNVKRKREFAQQDVEGDFDGEDAAERSLGSKRRRTVRNKGREVEADHGSDSEGNQWILGGVGSVDDESLDSDEAMGASDEERFEGFVFRGSSSGMGTRNHSRGSKTEKESGAIDLSEGEIDEELGDDFGDEGMDMAEVLDAGSEDTAEENDSDEASFKDEGDGTEGPSDNEVSDLSLSDDEADLQDSAKLASLKSLVTAMNETDESQAPTRDLIDSNESRAPSEHGLIAKQKLTVADLLPSITNPHLKKSLRILADDGGKQSSKHDSIARKMDVPLPKRQQDRLDRAAAYAHSKETLNRWIDTVKQNRRAEHLSFPLLDPNTTSAHGTNKLERQAKPLTDLERTIQSILQDSGLASQDGSSQGKQVQALEELETKKLPVQEVQARRADMRKARDLLFREETRAKRIKKIKSKSYRRVHRKERERLMHNNKEALAAAGIDDSESEKERNDRRRAEERMGAKHRESRWAKGVKQGGRMAWDEDARSGVEDMARREENLRRRIQGQKVDGSDEEDSSEDEEEEHDDNDESSTDKIQRRLQERLEKLSDNEESLTSGVKDSTSALASMKFMRKAEAALKAENDEALQRMQREIAGEQTSSEDETEEQSGRRSYGPTRSKLLPSKPEAAEKRGDFEEGSALDDDDDDDTEGLMQPVDEELQIVLDGDDAKRPAPKIRSLAGKGGKSKVEASSTQPTAEIEQNPWLSGGKPRSNARDRKRQDSHASAIISNELPVATTNAESGRPQTTTMTNKQKPKVQYSVATTVPASDDSGSSNEDDGAEGQAGVGLVFRNQDLVRKAFAGDDVVASFEKEKEEVMQSEDEKVIDNTLAGWGNWTGPGIGKKAQRRNQKRFLSKQEGVPTAKRQDAKLDKVIINEKRVKKTAKYLASQLPHPFETRQQYERSLRLPVGPEWITKETFQSATKPRILMKQGIIAPMSKPMV